MEYEYAVFDEDGKPAFILPGDPERQKALAEYFAEEESADVRRRQVGEWESL